MSTQHPDAALVPERPAIEEFIRLCSDPNSPWGMADSDVIDLCNYALHLEGTLSSRVAPTPDAALVSALEKKRAQLVEYIAGIDPTAGEHKRHALTFAEGRLAQLDMDIHALSSRLEVGEEERWQPIETAPLDGSVVLLWVRWANGYASEQVARYDDLRGQWLRGRNSCSCIYTPLVTHWQPLPAPPKSTDSPSLGGR